MRYKDRAVARRQIDKRLKSLETIDQNRPPYGWIKAIRDALGMTAAQLGHRLGVTRQRVLALEHAEITGAVTLDSLERAAHALDCRVVYALVPRKPLDALVRDRALLLARERLRTTSHSMTLESQAVDQAEQEEQLQRLTQDLVASAGSVLWNEK
jgi:predicted DNA-binding mobile mystery protein A